MKRLLCIINTMNMGGAETFLMKIYRTLDTSAFQMDFCVMFAEKCDYEDEILGRGGRFYRVPSKSRNAKAFQAQLTDIIRENKYQNVLRITSHAAGFWDLKIAKKAGAAHTVARSSNEDDGSRLQYWIHRVSRLLFMRYVDVKIAPSDLAALYTFGERAVKRGEVHFLNNGLDLSEYRFDAAQRRRIREEFQLSPDTAVVGHVGRFYRQKNHAFLLRVFAAFLQKHPDAVLMLVGVGDLEAEIKQTAAALGLTEHVIFTGLRKDVPALLSAFDVFVLPSLYEGMPNAAIEAQACGLPCILSDAVTREANLSGAVAYLPITETAPWVSQIETALAGGRIRADMSDYDIKAVARQFCRLCYSR